MECADVRALRAKGYRPREYYEANAELKRALDRIGDGTFSPGDPGHERATRVLPDGCGSMLSFEVAGSVEETEAVLDRLRLWTHATSLGGVESLIERRARYAGDAAVVPATLCRASVGLESVDDLWADLDGALRAVLG